MKRCGIFLILIFLCFSISAQDESGDGGIAETLFHHVMDSQEFAPFPFLPAIPLPMGITVHLLMLFLATILILSVFLSIFRKPGLKPKGLKISLEILILFVRDDIVYPVMGEKRGEKWLPFFSTLFIYLLVINYLGLIPAFKTATGNFTVTSSLALMILVLMVIIGFKNLGFIKFFKNYYPEGVSKPIGLFVALLEFIGTFIRIVVLSLRLFANMFAGHLAILAFLLLMFMLNPAFGIVSVPFTVFTFALEVLVALIQAMVFTLLSCIFITMSSQSH
ncbi:MAG: F0F1 ATP synthase subunit A [Spirochaetales bacterium]|nr:F0F1 ATP synthase subunit A [Spirochaetales bacterium]